MSRLREGEMASNILKSFPKRGMSSKRQEGAWWGGWQVIGKLSSDLKFATFRELQRSLLVPRQT